MFPPRIKEGCGLAPQHYPKNCSILGPVVQMVRTLACHARGRGFESHPGRHFFHRQHTCRQRASVAQLVEQGTENPRVVGSIPTGGTLIPLREKACGFSSSGRARPCQGRGGGFEPRNPLQHKTVWQPKAAPDAYNYTGNIRRHSQVVRQRSAKPLSPVRVRVSPPKKHSKRVLFLFWRAKSNLLEYSQCQIASAPRRGCFFACFSVSGTQIIKQTITFLCTCG